MKISSHAMRVILLASVLVSATALLLLLSSPTAQAEPADIVYVSNTGNGQDASFNVAIELAQLFHTGDDAGGYDLVGIELDLDRGPSGNSAMTVTVKEVDSAGLPGTTVNTLVNPTNVGSGLQRFTVSADTTLVAGTDYFVHVTATQTGIQSDLPQWKYNDDDEEDVGKADGWSIGDGSLQGGITFSSSFLIRVIGTNALPTASDGAVDTNGGTAYTFKAGDFGFMDTDTGPPGTLDHVKITLLPGTGGGDAVARR